jgi:hypothetical protein
MSTWLETTKDSVIVLTLLSSNALAWMKEWRRRSAAIPEQKQQKEVRRRSVLPFALPLVLIGLCMYSLHLDMKATGVLTRGEVFAIAQDTAEIAYGLAMIMFLGTLNLLRGIAEPKT